MLGFLSLQESKQVAAQQILDRNPEVKRLFEQIEKLRREHLPHAVAEVPRVQPSREFYIYGKKFIKKILHFTLKI